MRAHFLLTLILSLFVLILFMAGCGSDSQTVTPTLNYTVSGKITESNNSTPVNNASCLLTGEGSNFSNSTTTGTDGNYSFSNVPAGTYRLRVTATGHVTTNYIFSVSTNTTENISLISTSDWPSVMGSYPYDANKGYVFVSVHNLLLTSSSMEQRGIPISGVAVSKYPADYHDLGYMNTNGAVNWDATETYNNGQAIFYDVKLSQTYTIVGSKDGHTFETLSNVTPTAGEILHYTLGGTTGGTTYPTAIQTVANISPIKGICYNPSPHDFKGDGQGTYYDADFCNDSCTKWWGTVNGEGRDDLRKLSEAGVNFLHVYSMNQSGSGRNHINFMNYCDKLGMHMAFSVNTYYVSHLYDSNVNTWFDNFVSEAYNTTTNVKVRHPAVVMWCVGNEYDLGQDGQTADLIAKTVVKIIEAENRAGIPEANRIAITSPVSFGTFGDPSNPGIVKIKELKAAFEANGLSTVWTNRFIASVNPFNSGSYLQAYIQRAFPEQLPGLPFCFFEMGTAIGANGVTDELGQATYIDSQLVNVLPLAGKNGPFFGTCIFETVNEPLGYKQGQEATYGIYKISTPASTDGQYGVDTWAEKPSFSIVRTNYLSK